MHVGFEFSAMGGATRVAVDGNATSPIAITATAYAASAPGFQLEASIGDSDIQATLDRAASISRSRSMTAGGLNSSRPMATAAGPGAVSTGASGANAGLGAGDATPASAASASLTFTVTIEFTATGLHDDTAAASAPPADDHGAPTPAVDAASSNDLDAATDTVLDAAGSSDANAGTTSVDIELSFSADDPDAEVVETATVPVFGVQGSSPTTSGGCQSDSAPAQTQVNVWATSRADACSDSAAGGVVSGVGPTPTAPATADIEASWRTALDAAETSSLGGVSEDPCNGLWWR
jgi:hypothetical protein